MSARLFVYIVLLVAPPLVAQESVPPIEANAQYRQANLPIEVRVRDLIGRMTLEEKARQLDMYAGIPDLVDKAIDKTHAAPDAKFQSTVARKLFGELGVGSIHDLYPSAGVIE